MKSKKSKEWISTIGDVIDELLSEKRFAKFNKTQKITVEPVDNGFVLTSPDHNGDGNVVTVFEYDVDEHDVDEAVAVRALLNTIKNQLFDNRKYKKISLDIGIVHGHDYECENKNCKYCAAQTAIDETYGEQDE
jgi:hypothetical protein